MLEGRLHWISEEEGEICFIKEENKVVNFQFFIISDDEAELKLTCPKIVGTTDEIKNMPTEIISEMMECLVESFRLLWEEGYEETILVEQNSTVFGQILDSTHVVEKVYSEYMMRRTFTWKSMMIENLNSLDNYDNLIIESEEDELVCKSKDGIFSCRLLPHGGKKEGRCYYLYEVEVAKTYRNRGIATMCLNSLFRRLASLEGEEVPVTVLLQVGSYNEPAVHLYEKLGFEQYEELGCYVPAEG